MLGEEIARKFYTAGCKVILVGPNETELERVRIHLVSLSPKDVPMYQPECVTLDLTDTSEVPSKTAGILEQCGQVDILVNNASICTRSDVMSSALDTDIRVMNINYFGPIAFTKGTCYVCPLFLNGNENVFPNAFTDFFRSFLFLIFVRVLVISGFTSQAIKA